MLKIMKIKHEKLIGKNVSAKSMHGKGMKIFVLVGGLVVYIGHSGALFGSFVHSTTPDYPV